MESDLESLAIAHVAEALSHLDPDAAERVLRWAWARFIPPVLERNPSSSPPKKEFRG